jgi:hypothetical protein
LQVPLHVGDILREPLCIWGATKEAGVEACTGAGMRGGVGWLPSMPEVPDQLSLRCEVSERATHRSSLPGPCEPSARVTGRAQTYATDLPKRDSTLPEAASKRDQRSPHIRIVSPAIWACSCTIVTRIRPVHHNPRVLDAFL